MNTKTLLAGLVGGIAYFALGFILYGLVLGEDFMKSNFSCTRAPEEMIWWAMIASNLIFGFLIAIIFSWGNINTFMSGLTKGAFLGLVMLLGFDLGLYSMYDIYVNGINTMLVDIVLGVVMTAVGGGVVGWMLGRGNTAAA
ncbi:MAG: hypothetical protein ACKVQB_11005 [Bacteroidia bacterium]